MMIGREYAFSSEKRAFDIATATAATPFALGGRWLIGQALREQPGENSDPVFLQERIGAEGAPFTIRKFRTLDSETEEPLGATARIFRRYGLDELLQAYNIFRGEMSVVGYRPLPEAQEEAVFDNAGSGRLVDAWNRIVRPTKPGVLNSFSIRNHRHPDKTANMIRLAPLKLTLDIDDVFRGSLESDTAFIGDAFKALVIDEAPQAEPAVANPSG